MRTSIMKARSTSSLARLRLAAAGALVAALAIAFPAAAGDPDAAATGSNVPEAPRSAADLYDLFGFPSSDASGSERIVTALTFAPVPAVGRLDPGLLYRLRIVPAPRPAPGDDLTLEGMLAHFEAIRANSQRAAASEVRLVADGEGTARVSFHGFPAGDFGAAVPLDRTTTLTAPDGSSITVFIGGRDDAFAGDRSDLRAFPLAPTHFAKDAGRGSDPQAGGGVNALVLEMPLAFVTRAPDTDRIVSLWGESWRLRAVTRVPGNPAPPVTQQATAWVFPSGLFLVGALVMFVSLWTHTPATPGRNLLGVAALGGVILLTGVGAFVRDHLTRDPATERGAAADAELARYERIDTDGQPFADAAPDRRGNDPRIGADNIFFGAAFVRWLGHLGWSFGDSVRALGLAGSFDRDRAPVAAQRTYDSVAEAFPSVRRMLFQRLNMPDDSWNPRHLAIPLRRPVEIFVPNVLSVDMDTTGTWPFGRRFGDPVARRFLSLFLDMSATWNGRPYHVDLLGDPAVMAPTAAAGSAPHPPRNGGTLLAGFPYLGEPR
jgi:hypothetical protein